MKKVVFVFASALLLFGGNAFAKETKVSKKSKWCCTVEGKVAFVPGKKSNKKMCIKRSLEPTASSKSKLAQKYAKACTDSGGIWEKSSKTAMLEK